MQLGNHETFNTKIINVKIKRQGKKTNCFYLDLLVALFAALLFAATKYTSFVFNDVKRQ